MRDVGYAVGCFGHFRIDFFWVGAVPACVLPARIGWQSVPLIFWTLLLFLTGFEEWHDGHPLRGGRLTGSARAAAFGTQPRHVDVETDAVERQRQQR